MGTVQVLKAFTNLVNQKNFIRRHKTAGRHLPSQVEVRVLYTWRTEEGYIMTTCVFVYPYIHLNYVSQDAKWYSFSFLNVFIWQTNFAVKDIYTHDKWCTREPESGPVTWRQASQQVTLARRCWANSTKQCSMGEVKSYAWWETMQIRLTIFWHLATDSKISSQLRLRPSVHRIPSPFVTHIAK